MNSTCELGRHGASALKPYPAYRDSGVEWLGEVPAHWEVRRLKNVASLVMGQSPVSEDCSTARIGLPFLQGCAEFGADHPRPVQFCRKPAKVSPVGATLMSVRAPVGRLNVADQRYGIGRGLCAVAPHISSLDARFCRYSLDRSAFGLTLQSTGSTYDAVSVGDVACLPTVVPPLPEQAAIVRFLDHADRRIRRYIRAKEKLIALLEEQKQAVIHEAVTGQIDVRTGQPYPAYMDSGVEWLGEVPSHWKVKRIGRFSKVGNGSTPSRGNPAYWSNGDHPWLNSSSVNKGTIAAADQFVTVRALRECHLPRVPANSVLVGITGQGKTRGMAALLTIDATINQHMAYITPSTDTISPRYLHICLAASYAELRGLSSASGSTKEALTCEDIKTFRLVLPPIDEQEVLLSAVARRLQSLDRCTSDARRQIDLAQEYRTRLIADVVTGKLDVRGVAAGLPEPDAPADDDTPDGIRAASGLDTRAEELATGGVGVRHREVEVRGAADAATVAWWGAEEAVAGDRR